MATNDATTPDGAREILARCRAIREQWRHIGAERDPGFRPEAREIARLEIDERMARGIIEAHAARVRAEAEVDGRGRDLAAVERERDGAVADAKRLREREEHFARALAVADGGQYRNDWPGAIGRLIAERDDALSLAYIGDHRFPDLTWKARAEEAGIDARAANERARTAEREVARLTECLQRANATLEETERALYLEAQAAEAARDRLRAASQALAGIDAATLDAVTPAAMRAVMGRRGWRKVADVPLHPGLPAVAWERYERATRSLTPEVHVIVCEAPADERRDAVLRWATVVAYRHGDVSPAEVLAEALAEGAAK